jgi:hypothetical protein
MANFLKLTMFFNAGVSGNGWQESWLVTATPSGAGVLNFAQSAALARNNLVGQGAGIVGVKLGQPGVPGSTQLVPFQDQRVPVPGLGGKPFACQDPHWGFIMNVRASTVANPNDSPGWYRRNFFLRGVPESACSIGADTEEVFISSTVYQGFRDTWIALMTGGNFFMKVISKAQPRKFFSMGILGVLPNNVVFTTVAAHGLALGDTVAIRGLPKTWRIVNGVYRVIGVGGANQFTINVPAWPTGLFLPGGWAVKRGYSFAQVTSIATTRPAHHETGRPTGVTRGRYNPRALVI